MTRTWQDKESGSLEKAKALRDINSEMLRCCDEHFKDYDFVQNACTLNLVAEYEHDFEIFFKNLTGFVDACEVLECTPEDLKKLLKYNYVQYLGKKLNKSKEWK